VVDGLDPSHIAQREAIHVIESLTNQLINQDAILLKYNRLREKITNIHEGTQQIHDNGDLPACCLVPNCPLPAARCPLPPARCPLPAARCPLPAARCPLPAACCLLPAACCLVPGTQGRELQGIHVLVSVFSVWLFRTFFLDYRPLQI
jgi:hypothetical protein